jgi:PIN domain nuclease of toxin-antitoxin system
MEGAEVILLDTHAWIWWVSDSGLLSAKARNAVKAAVDSDEVHVSAISAWEVAVLVKRGRLKLTMETRDWIARSETLPFFKFVPVSARIAVESIELPEFPHDDRLIASSSPRRER